MNRALLKHYTILVDFLSRVVGPDYEIALHDLSDKGNAIAAIANGHISGRTLGSPMPGAMLEAIAEAGGRDANFRINYSGLSVGNKVLRCSALYIKDLSGKPVGLLCINFDDSRYQELSARLLRLCHPDEFVGRSLVIRGDLMDAEPAAGGPDADSLTAIADSVIREAVSEGGVPVERLTPDEKTRIVGMLNQRGVFSLKGSVNHVSRALHCSPASIYRYLNKLGQRSGGPG